MSRKELGGGWKTAGDLDWRLLGTLGRHKFGTKGNTVSGVQRSMKILRQTSSPLQHDEYHKFRVQLSGKVKVKTIDRHSYDADGYGHICKSGTQHPVEGWLTLCGIISSMSEARSSFGSYTEYYVAYNSYGFAVGYTSFDEPGRSGYIDDRVMVGLLRADDKYRRFENDFPCDPMRLVNLETLKKRTIADG